MKWCEAVGTEPYLCFNFGTGTLDEGKLVLGIMHLSSTDAKMYSFGLGRVLQRYRQHILCQPSSKERS